MSHANTSVPTHMRPVLTQIPEQLLCPPYALRNEMSWIDFSGTENPFGTPASFIRALINALEGGMISYAPDRETHTLRSVLAKTFYLPIESFLVGSTVSTMIRTVAQAFTPCTVGMSMPCPTEYIVEIQNTGHEVKHISSPLSFVAPDADTLAKRNIHIDAAVLLNPGYPTSRLLPKSTLLSYLDVCNWVVVDERSIELTLGGESMAPLVQDHKNLIVIQSFSEQYAMPGAPISYCIAHPDTITQIAKFYDNSGISMIAEVVAEESYAEHAKLDRVREFLDTEIPWLQCMLNLIPGIDIFPAEANYVMCSYQNTNEMKLGAADVSELSSRLQLAGFLIRKLANTPGLDDNDGYFCVAVRTREENEKLVAAVRKIVQETTTSF